MIQILRSTRPPSLNESSTADLYDKPKVRSALHKMQHDKCCYCEAKLPLKHAGQPIEHFWPKAKNKWPEKKNCWKNLLLACPMCNGEKSDKFPLDNGVPELIDPSDDEIDPEDHIGFIIDVPLQADLLRGSVVAKTPKGQKTIETIGLDSVTHTVARYTHFRIALLDNHHRLLMALDSGDTMQSRSLISEFEHLMSAREPWAAFVRAFVRDAGLDKVGVSIPSGYSV